MGTRAKVEDPTQRSLSSEDLRAVVSALANLDAEVGDAERIAQIRALEEIKNAAAAAQARVSVDLDTSQRLDQARSGVPASERGRGVAAQIALARRESRHRGGRLLGLARLLVKDLPHTLAAMERGELSEWRATLLAKSAVVLEDADRALLDARLGPRLEGMSDREVDAAARSIAHQVDPAALVNRARRAVEDRRVSVRPAPDVMAIVSAYVPAAQGVAVYKALTDAAASAKASGDPRGLDQIKADTLVELVTGQRTAAAVPLEVGLVMTDAALLARTADLARLVGYGPVPAAAARDLVAGASDHGAPPADAEAGVWLRRLYTDPFDGSVAHVDTRRRRFTGALRRLVLSRDEVCRTPWCDAPARDVDHVEPFAAGGATTAANGQGLCRACNLDKTAPGWRAGPEPPPQTGREQTGPGQGGLRRSTAGPLPAAGARGAPSPMAAHVVYTTTPTGATYWSAARSALPEFGPERADELDELDWGLREEAHAALRADLERLGAA